MEFDRQILAAEKRVDAAKATLATLRREPDRAYAASCFAKEEMEIARAELRNAQAALYALRMPQIRNASNFRLAYSA